MPDRPVGIDDQVACTGRQIQATDGGVGVVFLPGLEACRRARHERRSAATIKGAAHRVHRVGGDRARLTRDRIELRVGAAPGGVGGVEHHPSLVVDGCTGRVVRAGRQRPGGKERDQDREDEWSWSHARNV